MDLFNELKGMKILLIDDDEWIRDSLNIFFESEGCRITTFETAEEALEELQGQSYDIIIADYRLPSMNGLELFKRIEESHSHAIKIIITAYKDKEVIAEANKRNIHDFIDKPFTTKTIEETLSRVIKNSQYKPRS